ncbi:MAG: hypothetical protein ABI239_04380 [Aquihabitans sp.]
MTGLTTDTPLADSPGQVLIRADVVGTVAFVIVTVGASVIDGNAVTLANIVVSSVLFLGGCVAFGAGFLRAAGRSRTEVVDMTGLFYLTGTAPRAVRRTFLGLWFLQIVVATVSVFTVAPPFGVMAPLWGIGLTAAWGARHGTFSVRPAKVSRTDGSAPQ